MSKPTETELLPERIIDAVANAIMDEMDCINTEQKMFAASLPRDKYLPSMRRYALAAVTAYVRHSPTSSSAEVRARARELVDEWRNTWRGMSDACMTANRIDLIDRIARLSTPQPTLSDSVQAESDAYARGYQDGSVSQPTLQQAIECVKKLLNEHEQRSFAEFGNQRLIEKATTDAYNAALAALSSLASTKCDKEQQ